MNNCIQKIKRIEKEYKTNRKILSQMANGLKELISDCLLFLRNSFKIHFSEIDIYINEIVPMDEYSKCDKLNLHIKIQIF